MGVTVVTLTNDLFIAVLAGILFTGVVYAWQSGMNIVVTPYLSQDGMKKVYAIKGPLFFGSAQRFIDSFNNVENDPDEIEIDFRSDASRIYDFSGFNALNVISEKYKKEGKTVRVKKLDVLSRKRLSKANLLVKNFEYCGEDGKVLNTTLSVVSNNQMSISAPSTETNLPA